VRAFLVLALCACSSSVGDVTGPFTGEVRRYVVDAIRVPHDSAEAAAFAADLDGDGAAENQLGNVTAVLAAASDLSPHAADMIASGALASYVTIQADDLVDDDSVAVTYVGAAGADAVAAGGRFVGGAFVSNRTRDTRAPGRAVVRLPVFVNADPLELGLYGMEIELSPDGSGGFTGIVRGGIREGEARAAALAGLVQMFETEPDRHLVFGRTIDRDRDDVITLAEIDESVIALLVKADIALFDGDRVAAQPTGIPDALSVAFSIHLRPCPEGLCSMALPAEPCRDRVRGGDETDVDCGGSCQTCWAGKQCQAGTDCQSGACDAGRCRMHTCSAGVQDGYESDIDCGGSCGTCATGRACAADSDCASTNCNNGVASLGQCL
jgi:hypothetical protein